jgi:uncharacterized protein YigE (DUF2233 family)
MSNPALFFLLALALVGHVLAAPEETEADGVRYRVLRAQANSVRVIWKNQNNKPLRTFPATARYLMERGERVLTLMNGGIFEPEGVPSGLLIQDGHELRPVNRIDGKGNFYLKPNGVFLIGSQGAAVITTDEYPPAGAQTMFAVQSGPLLLRRGRIHPKFNPISNARLHRNGVGVTAKGEVVFAITDLDSPKFPNLYEFAQFFRSLGCENALFLDGDLSQMKTEKDTMNPSNHFGSIIAVVETHHQ